MTEQLKTPDIPAFPADTQKEVKKAFVIIKDWARLVSIELNKRITNTVTLYYNIMYPINNQSLVYDSASGYWRNKTVDHSWLQGILQADDTSTSSEGGKHVTDAMLKKYEDHRLITNGNPHGTALSQLTDVDIASYTNGYVLTVDSLGEWTAQPTGSGAWDSLTGTANIVPMNTSPTSVPTTEGTLSWSATDHTLTIQPDISVSSLQVGLENWMRAVNKTGAIITDGTVVYISGAQGNRPKISLAKADSESTSYTIGVATSDIEVNQEGFVTVLGVVHGFNTSGYAAGDKLYLSASTAGQLTNVRPSAPNHGVFVAFALNSTPNGSIFVNPSVGFELDELHNVLISTPTSGNTLKYDGTKWINNTLTYSDVGAEPANSNIQAHISNTSNPHSTTASQVGAISVAAPAFVKIPAETTVALGSGTGTRAVDLSTGSVFTATCTGACAWNFTNAPSGAWSTTLILTNAGLGAQTFQVAGSAKTPKLNGGTALTYTSAGVDILEVFSPDGGTTLYVGQSYKDAK